ncbi:retropepsin-like aspartic protease [Anaerolineales bacterium HSG25]|nr:retropepsin-like aspartic protease [Anaerolineales bacterium HSG25]
MRADRIEGIRGYGNTLIIPCELNNRHHVDLLVDTGSVYTAISKQSAALIGLDLSQPVKRLSISTAQSVISAPLFYIDALQVGGWQVKQIEVIVLSLPTNIHVDGLLGVNFLRRFRTTFEFDQATLVLRQT